MGKPALGKGLGQLMAGQQTAARKSVEAVPAAKVTAVDFGRGLATLVRSGQTESQPEKAADLKAKKVLLPAWFFFAADILLLAYTVAICFDAGTPMRLGEVLFAATSTLLGALLAIFGVLRSLPAE